MQSINNVTISGYICTDTQLSQTTTGMSVLSFVVAVNDKRKDSKTGDWEDYPNFVEVTFFSKQAEGLSKILNKGSKVFVNGKINQSRWESNGEKRSKISIVGTSIDFGSPKSQNENIAVTKAKEAQMSLTEDIPF